MLELLFVLGVLVVAPVLYIASQSPGGLEALFGGLILLGLFAAKRYYAAKELQGSKGDGSTLT
jgi:hypothetical protein